MNNTPDPREALDAIAATGRNLPERLPGTMRYPVVYDLLYGSVCGLLVAGQGLPAPWSLIAPVAALAGLAFLFHWWRRAHGWWVSGYSPRRARWVAFAMIAIFLCLIGVSLWGRQAGIVWMPILTGGAGFATAIIGGRLWMRVWRRELEAAGK